MNVELQFFLIKATERFKPNVCRLEKIELYIRSNISSVTINATVVISQLDILHIIEVMDARF